MQWMQLSVLKPSLPSHCEPTNDFLLHFSSAFHTCIPAPQAFVSNSFGILSIVSWLFAQLPQIYRNWSISSTAGLSIWFLVEWCLGDLSNLLGALFTHQASWQVAIGCYYVFVDVCLVSQWFWYEKLRHGRIVRRIRQKYASSKNDGSSGGLQEMVVDRTPSYNTQNAEGDQTDPRNRQDTTYQGSKPQNILRMPKFAKLSEAATETPGSSLSATPNGTFIYRIGPASPLPSPNPRTLLLIACLAALTQASPLHASPRASTPLSDEGSTVLESVGTAFSWTSTILYLGSRLPQLYKNWRRKSTAGLSPLLFAAAFCGNMFYSLALLTNPRAWQDFGPHGGGGWVGSEGNDRVAWVLAALPFFLGAGGVLGLDASMGLQFILYGDGNSKVLVLEDSKGRRWRWRRVEGWMRGWIPSNSGDKSREAEGLLARNEQHSEGYGALRSA